jgi:hypothetical protein
MLARNRKLLMATTVLLVVAIIGFARQLHGASGGVVNCRIHSSTLRGPHQFTNDLGDECGSGKIEPASHAAQVKVAEIITTAAVASSPVERRQAPPDRRIIKQKLKLCSSRADSDDPLI